MEEKSMAAEIPSYYVYRIDGSDVVSFVSPEWVRFAQSNEAPELTAEQVVGKPIWHFVAGKEARTLYEQLYASLRSRRADISIPFRCDAPAQIRQMTLTLRSLGAGGIECEGRLDRIEARESVAALSRHGPRSEESISICSLCRRVSVFDEWMEIRAAIVRKRLFGAMPLPRLDENVCPDCKRVGA
jgi:hypothetical protein